MKVRFDEIFQISNFWILFRETGAENWENDIPVPSYDPLKVASEKNVILGAKCVPKKALKEFRSQEKYRLNNLKEKKEEVVKPENADSVLRKPEMKGQGRGLLRSTMQARAAKSPMPSRRLTSDVSAYDALMTENFQRIKLWKFSCQLMKIRMKRL